MQACGAILIQATIVRKGLEDLEQADAWAWLESKTILLGEF